MSHGADILITGIPRSGTTLVCSILGEQSDVVAAHEPIDPGEFGQNIDVTKAMTTIRAAMKNLRHSIDSEGLIVSKQNGGRIPTNSVDSTSDHKLRREVTRLGSIAVEQPLSEKFILAVKHNALFTSLLSQLMEEYPVYAIVRNPLAVLHSWQTVDFPISKGRIPMGERFDSQLSQILDQEVDVLARQLEILNWFFKSFRSRLIDGRTLRYEEIISSQGEALSPILGRLVRSRTILRAQFQARKLQVDQAVVLRDALLRRPEIYEDFYRSSEIRHMFEAEFV